MTTNPNEGSRIYEQFVRVESGTPVARDNFPRLWKTDSGQRPTDDWLRTQEPAYYGWVATPQPTYNPALEKIVELPLANLAPNHADGIVMQVWQVVSLTSEEIAQREADAWSNLRSTRNAKLSETDWTQVADAPVDQAAWATYRQALRDLPQNTTDPFNPVWPVEPA